MRFWLFLGLVCTTLAGCIQGYDLTINYRNRFFERLKSFEHKRAQIKSSFNLVFETLEMKLQSPEPNFRNIAWEWDSRMRSLERQVQDLEAELVKMDTLANFFYKQLRDISLKITDSTMRVREKLATKNHETEWRNWRAYARRNMERTKNAILMGKDAHKVFVASGIRTKRTAALKATREVRQALFASMRRLERFSNAVQLLTSLEQENLIPEEIRKMEVRRESIVKRLHQIAKTMEGQLNDKGRELQEISWKWESKYADMRYDLESLSDDFENLKLLTKNYYDKSFFQMEKIVNKNIREQEDEAQKAHEAKLEKIYAKVAQIRKTIVQDFRFSDDTYLVLINSARRREVGKAIESLKQIRTKIANSLIDLRDTLKELRILFTPEKNSPKTLK